jgi:hypothetical protein
VVLAEHTLLADADAKLSSELWAASSSPLGAGQANRRSQDGTRSRFTIDYEVQKA